MRHPEMSWFKMPLFVWSLYATAWVQVLATPIIGITLLLVMIEREKEMLLFTLDNCKMIAKPIETN